LTFILEKAEVGEGWRPLVEECHARLQAAFPDYELLAVKQKWGALELHAQCTDGPPGPRPHA
jgi:hypothetical protein